MAEQTDPGGITGSGVGRVKDLMKFKTTCGSSSHIILHSILQFTWAAPVSLNMILFLLWLSTGWCCPPTPSWAGHTGNEHTGSPQLSKSHLAGRDHHFDKIAVETAQTTKIH